MNNSGKIVQLVDPSNNQDAATKRYVDNIISYNGSGSLFPTVERNDTTNGTHYLTFINSVDLASSDGQSKRVLLRSDVNGPTYNPSTNTLTAGTFSGSLSGNASTATSAGSATTAEYATRTPSNKFTINGGSSYTNDIPADTMLLIKDQGWGYGPRIRLNDWNGYNFSIGKEYNNATCYVLNHNNGPLFFGTNGSERMRITGDGNVCIGSTSAQAKLHVEGSVQYYTGDIVFLYIPDRAYYTRGSGGNWDVGIYCASILRTGGSIITHSDKRIKKNIREIDGNNALSQIRRLQPKIYNYIDATKQPGDIYGFIAQDVKDIIPNSTNTNTEFIPNLYCPGVIRVIDVSNHIYEISTENDLTFQKIFDNSVNEITNYKIKIVGHENIEYICNIVETICENKRFCVKFDKEYKFSPIEEYKNKVFIYGQEVHDFYNIDKNSIFTVATAALQEVDRQQQTDKARIAELEAAVAAQQSLINDIHERLKTLEKA